MIRVWYTDGTVEAYKSIKDAQFEITMKLFCSDGAIIPESAVEEMARLPGGTCVERQLNIKLGIVELT